MQKPRLSFWQIWNMSFGFLGIQFGWGLQMANMSPIYTYLGAKDEQLAKLWLAAPLTGLIIQPIIEGDERPDIWGKLGRRRPYFLVGAILSSLALLRSPPNLRKWPRSSIDAASARILHGGRVAVDPGRQHQREHGTFPGIRGATKLPEEQRGMGFTMQSLLIGIGAVVADQLPYILNHWFHVSSDTSADNAIPLNVKIAFYAGAAVFLSAVLWTIITTKEYPPENSESVQSLKKARLPDWLVFHW